MQPPQRGAGHHPRGARPGPGLGRLAVAVRRQGLRVVPPPAEVLRLAGLGDLQPTAGQQGRAQRRDVDLVDGRTGAEVHLGRPAVERRDTVAPEPAQQVGVVAVAQERLGVASYQVGVQVRDHGDLVVAADGREHRPDLRVAEGGVEVGRPVDRGGVEPPGRRVLDRDQPGDLLRAASSPARARRGRRRARRTTATARRPGRRARPWAGATRSWLIGSVNRATGSGGHPVIAVRRSPPGAGPRASDVRRRRWCSSC